MAYDQVIYPLPEFVQKWQIILNDLGFPFNKCTNEEVATLVPLYAQYIQQLYEQKRNIYLEIDSKDIIFASINVKLLTCIEKISSSTTVRMAVADFFINHHKLFYVEHERPLTVEDLKYRN